MRRELSHLTKRAKPERQRYVVGSSWPCVAHSLLMHGFLWQGATQTSRNCDSYPCLYQCFDKTRRLFLSFCIGRQSFFFTLQYNWLPFSHLFCSWSRIFKSRWNNRKIHHTHANLWLQYFITSSLVEPVQKVSWKSLSQNVESTKVISNSHGSEVLTLHPLLAVRINPKQALWHLLRARQAFFSSGSGGGSWRPT